LADQNRVRILAQRGVERGGKGRAVHADLALADQAHLALMHELDRILDRDDVALEAGVDRVDDRGERRRFAGARLAGDENEPAVRVPEAADGFRHPELLERQRTRRYAAEY